MTRDHEQHRGVPSARRFGALLFVAALLLRLGAAFALREPEERPDVNTCGADCVEFESLGRQLALGNGYASEKGRPTAFRAPGFPLVVAGIYTLAGFKPWAAYAAFAVMGALAVVLVWLTARRLTPGLAAAAAGVMAAIYLPHVYFASLYYSENLSALSLAAMALSSLLFLRGGSPLHVLAAGAALGVSILARPFAILLAPALVAIFLFQGRGRTIRSAAACVLLAAGALAVVTPWMLRNLEVFGSPVFGSTNGGSTFYGGNNDVVATRPGALGSWVSPVELPGRDWVEQAPDEVAHDRREWALGVAWVRSNPDKLPRLLAAKLVRYWLPDMSSRNWKYVALQVAATAPCLVVVLVGLAVTLREPSYRTAGWLVMHAVTLATLACGLIFWGAPRFRDGSFAPLMLYGGVGIEWLWRQAKPLAARAGAFRVRRILV
jgi:4-amino-4-deoxy-L-arabinose transferase-like glycosyltransferase